MAERGLRGDLALAIFSISGFVDVPPEDRAAFERALPKHSALTHAEPGCIRFDVTPVKSRPGRYKVDEAFIDEAAFKAHQDRTRKTEWFEITRNIERHYTVSQ